MFNMVIMYTMIKQQMKKEILAGIISESLLGGLVT